MGYSTFKRQKNKQCWEICVECNMYGALLHQKLSVSYMQSFAKDMPTELINGHYNFIDFNFKK